MHPREVEKKAQRYPNAGRDFALELARRIGANLDHLKQVAKLRGKTHAEISQELKKGDLAHLTGDPDKARRLAALAGGNPFKSCYVRGIAELAQRLGVAYVDLLPKPEPQVGFDPGSKGERALMLQRSREIQAANAARKAAEDEGEDEADEDPTPEAALAPADSTPEPQGA